MKRREFIALVGGAAVGWPLATLAQNATPPVVGLLSSSSPDQFVEGLRAFNQGLAEIGFVEGRNVAIEYRWAEDQNNRLPLLAADLVNRRVAVIASVGASPAALAAKAATLTIPTVFQIGADPVGLGLIESLNRPGGNATGVTSLNSELNRKRLEILHELMPTANNIALLVNETNTASAERQTKNMLAAGNDFGLQFHVLQASEVRQFDAVFSSLRELRADALVIVADPLFALASEQLAALSLRSGVPAISPYGRFAVAGGLMSYGGDLNEQYRQVGTYVGRILKGEKPGDLPVQQITKVEFVVNLKTAKALGLRVPLTLLGRADEVIE
jgi:putative tryptophan/tyrosine transport system substrate-binding protein